MAAKIFHTVARTHCTPLPSTPFLSFHISRAQHISSSPLVHLFFVPPLPPHLTPRTRLPPTPPCNGPLLEGVRHTHVCTQEKAAFGVHDPCDCTAKGRLVWANGDAYEGQVRLQYTVMRLWQRRRKRDGD